MKKALSLSLSLATILFLTSCASSAKFEIPKVGLCYDLSSEELSSVTSISPAVDCLALHNSETYKVGKWSKSENPLTLTDTERQNVAKSICLPWNLPSDTILNYWVFFLPNSDEWKKGARWVRCDAMNKYQDSRGNDVFDSWKGVKTSNESSPQEGALIPSGETVFIYLEPNSGGCLGGGSVKAGNKVVLVETNPQLNPSEQPVISSSTLYGREGGCGLGADFEIKSSRHAKSGTVYDETSKKVLGIIDLTVGGNTNIYIDESSNQGSNSKKTNSGSNSSNSNSAESKPTSLLKESASKYFIPGTMLSTVTQVWGISLYDSNGPRTLQDVVDDMYLYFSKQLGRNASEKDFQIGFQPGNSMYNIFNRLVDNVFVYQAIQDRLIADAQNANN